MTLQQDFRNHFLVFVNIFLTLKISQIAREMGAEVEISNITEEYGVLSIAGPKAGHLLSRITDSQVTVQRSTVYSAQADKLLARITDSQTSTEEYTELGKAGPSTGQLLFGLTDSQVSVQRSTMYSAQPDPALFNLSLGLLLFGVTDCQFSVQRSQ